MSDKYTYGTSKHSQILGRLTKNGKVLRLCNRTFITLQVCFSPNIIRDSTTEKRGKVAFTETKKIKMKGKEYVRNYYDNCRSILSQYKATDDKNLCARRTPGLSIY
jgi:hypothetical protein